MNFNELYLEAKGTKPGERYSKTKESEGPSGITSSPIGKDSYNPEKVKKGESKSDNTGVVSFETGLTKKDVAALSNALRILKNDSTFETRMKGAMRGFKSRRHQISEPEEKILKSYDGIIDKLDGKIDQYLKRIFNASKQETYQYIKKDTGKKKEETIGTEGKQTLSKEELEAKLQELRDTKEKYQEILDATRNKIENLVEENEDLNNHFLEEIVSIVKFVANDLYKKYADKLGEEEKKTQLIPIHELDMDKLEKESTDNAIMQLQLLEMLLSEDTKTNPFLKFLDSAEHSYENSKDRAYQLSKGDNYDVIVNGLYEMLPILKFTKYYYNAINKSPKIQFSSKQEDIVSKASKGAKIVNLLPKVKTKEQFEKIKPRLRKYIKGLKSIDEDRREMLLNILEGPFQIGNRRANAALKIYSVMKTSQVTESFDEYAAKIMKESFYDEDDFELDLMKIESLMEKNAKCTGPTKKSIEY